MTALEKTYALFSPAAGGGEKSADGYLDSNKASKYRGWEKVGEIDTVISLVYSREETTDDVSCLVRRYVACVRDEKVGEITFRRGMMLEREGMKYRIVSAEHCLRLWVLTLEDAIMDGEV